MAAAVPLPLTSSNIPDDLVASAEILQQAIVEDVNTRSSSFSDAVNVAVKNKEEDKKESDRFNLLFTFNGNELNDELEGRSLATLICPVTDYIFFDVDFNNFTLKEIK